MSLFTFFRSANKNRGLTGSKRSRFLRLSLEALEDRFLPCCSSISGYVFVDANNNGIFDAGESPIANSSIQLRNASGTVIGTTVTDNNGFYKFGIDSTISTQAVTLTQTATLANMPTDWIKGLTVQQFDPSLGTLLSVDIVNAGTFSSQIKVESLDGAPSSITATDAGTLTLTGPGFTSLVTSSSTSKTFDASAFDGIIDFSGTSGHDFGLQSADGSNSATVSNSADLAAYRGTGFVSFSDAAHANSSATGAGNMITQINTNATARVTVVYHYIPSNCLKPGFYTVVQVSQPPNILEGLESSNGLPIPGSVGTDAIAVTLGTTNSTNNDFAELQPSSLSGFVYYDQNDNGSKVPGDPPIPNTRITLTGANDLGPVSLTTSTAGDGSYQFSNLRPGSYTISETQPANYLQGKNSLGSLGGTMGVDQFQAIVLPLGAAGVNYNFGEVLGASISGFVYLDVNHSGVMDPGDLPIPNTTITLSGTDDMGAAVNQTQVSAADGSYAFRGLRPGTYNVTETPPAGLQQGTDNLGSAGGTVAVDQFENVTLAPAVAGVNYNFGHLQPTGEIQVSSFACPNFSWGHPDVMILSKLQFLSTSPSSTTDPVLKAQATYVDGLYRAILGRPADEQGLVGWLVGMHSGLAPTQVVQSIWNSAEHRGMEVDNFYATILGRRADAAGRALWVNMLMAGTSEATVEVDLYTSAEYQAWHPDNTSFVTGLYADVLSRTATSAEIANVVQQLQNGATRAAVAQSFVTSAEADSQSLQCDYRAYLGRAPDAASLQNWLAAMSSGQLTPAAVTQLFLASSEFLADAQQTSLS